MKIAIIGRSQYLYETALLLLKKQYQIPLIITYQETPEYTKTSADFEKLAHEIGATYIFATDSELPAYYNKIRELGPIDLGISLNYTGVISQEVIDFFPLGILNGHTSELPKYRGDAPFAWAILNRESKVAYCIQKMVGGELDSGNIMAREYYNIDIDTRVGELFNWMEERTPSLMLEAVEKLNADRQYIGEAQSNDPQNALRGYPRLPEDGRIDWKQSNEDILRLINASSEPFAGAFCEYEGEQLVIWRARLFEDEEVYAAVAGQISAIKSDGNVVVITGKGKLEINEISYKGERGKPANIIKSIRKRLK